MGIRRYELNEVQWERIAPLRPGKASDPGRTGLDNRLFVNGCLWILRSGAHWCDLPERYGRWKTVHRRSSRWCHAGAWERVFDTLAADRDNSDLPIDSTVAPNLLDGLQARAVLADKAYDGNDLRARIAAMNAAAVIPSKRNRKVFIPHDTAIYKHRNQIERCFGPLKHSRRFATRYDRRVVHFIGCVHLAAAMIWLR